MNWREDYAKEAAQDGRRAARFGDDKNPHTPGSITYAAWEQGWEGVQVEEELIVKVKTKYPPQPRKKTQCGNWLKSPAPSSRY